MQKRKRFVFGLLVSISMSLLMNLIFLKFFQQPFEIFNWLSQLPLTIPIGAITGALTGIFLAKKMPDLGKWQRNCLFSLTMSLVMSLIMAPWALIPRIGFDFLIISKGILLGIPIGFVVASAVVPIIARLVYGTEGAPEPMNKREI